jgi:uncharacterized protein
MIDFRPTQGQERLDLLDALRGFALCGILIANLEGFTGAYLLSPPELSAQPIARAILFLNNWLIEGKFYALFSMLFGIGFALQTERARKAGISFLPLWYRRMAALTLIGLLHMLMIWHGDILTLYSLLGMSLPLFIDMSDRRLRQCIIVLLLLPLGIHLLVIWTRDNAFWSSLSDVTAAVKIKLGYEGRELLQMRASTSPLEVLSSNWLSAIPRPMAYLQTGRIPQVLGQFLLGVWLARVILPRLRFNERLPRTLWLICGVIGLLAGFGYAWIKGATGSAFALNATGMWQGVIYHTSSTLLALGYAGAFAHLWNSFGEKLPIEMRPHNIRRQYHGNTLARPALQRENIGQDARFHGGRDSYSSPGHWREYRHFQRRPCRADRAPALRRAGAHRHPERARRHSG